MYDNNEKSAGSQSLNEARIIARRAYNNVKYVSNKVIKIKRKADKFVINKAINEHSKLTNKNNPDLKSKVSTVSKSAGKNIARGTIRINGRIAESLYDKSDDASSGLNAVLDAGTKTRRAVETGKDVVNGVKTTYKASKKSVDIAKKTVSILSKLIISNPFIFIFLLICIIMIVIASNFDGDEELIIALAGGWLSADVIVTDEDTIESYKELLATLDAELNDSVKNSEDYILYDTVEITGSAKTSFKEILSLIAALKEQEIEFNTENSDSFKLIHSKMYKVDAETSTYECGGCYCSHVNSSNCPGNCKCRGHSKITVSIVSYTFEEMFDILEFTDDQKELAGRFVEKDYSEIYSNFE